ncbi:MAG: acyl-CoA dehydrogenase family protein [Chloroflexi bacterium]|nr:acyl-CoA dehydrogenase family protein [Chloroflexota bacterium]
MPRDVATQFDDPDLEESYKSLQASVRQFSEEKVVPIADEYDRREAEMPLGLIREMGRLGYFGVSIPEQWGGAGLGVLGLVIATEELCRGWLSVGSVIFRNVPYVLMQHGTEEQKRKYLPAMARGELLAATAGTEPEAGSDAANVQTMAVQDGDSFVLNGTKMFCTFANRAHVIFTYCRTNPRAEPRHRGISCLMVEKEPGDSFDPPGLTGQPIPTVGYHGMRTWQLFFQDYRVPAENMVGGPDGLNRGFYQLMASYEPGRIQVAARAVGVARAAYEAAVKHAQGRVQFGHAIANYQAVRFRLADMATEILAAKRLLYYAARTKDRSGRCDLEAGMAKLFATEAACRVADAALQLHGGLGYSRLSAANRFWRDARLLTIGEGTSDIQRRIIADTILDKAEIPG